MTTQNKPQTKKFVKKSISICLSQPKIAQKPQLIFLGTLNDNDDIICLSAQFNFTSFLNGQDNKELKFAVNGLQLFIESYNGQNYEITKICRVIGSQEIIVEINKTAGKPKPVHFDFEPVIYKIGDRYKFQLLNKNHTEWARIGQNTYVV